MQKGGIVVQSGTPQDLYNKPIDPYVAGFFGETNKFTGIVKNAEVQTPIGKIQASKDLESKKIEHKIFQLEQDLWEY